MPIYGESTVFFLLRLRVGWFGVGSPLGRPWKGLETVGDEARETQGGIKRDLTNTIARFRPPN